MQLGLARCSFYGFTIDDHVMDALTLVVHTFIPRDLFLVFI